MINEERIGKYRITCRSCGVTAELEPAETAWGNLCVGCQRVVEAALSILPDAVVKDVVGGACASEVSLIDDPDATTSRAAARVDQAGQGSAWAAGPIAGRPMTAGFIDDPDVTITRATTRPAVDEDGNDEWHVECWFSNGGKYAPIVVDGEHEELADLIAGWLNPAEASAGESSSPNDTRTAFTPKTPAEIDDVQAAARIVEARGTARRKPKREWRITWNRPGGCKTVKLRQTEAGARALFERRAGEDGSECMIPDCDPYCPGGTCLDRESDDPCVICAEQYAEHVTIQVRDVGPWEPA